MWFNFSQWLVYQSPDGTLTDKEASQLRYRIIQRLDRELGAKLRL